MFLTKVPPIDRAHSGLSIGTDLVKNKPMLTKLQALKVNSVNNKVGNPSGVSSKIYSLSYFADHFRDLLRITSENHFMNFRNLYPC